MAQQEHNMTTEERLDVMQQQMDKMSNDIVKLTDALRNKSAMITKLSAEIEKLNKRFDNDEFVKIEDAKQISKLCEMEEKEIKEEMDKMPIPDLTVKTVKNNDDKVKDDDDDKNKKNKKKDDYKGYLILWSGSSGYKNEAYNKIQLMNLKKYKETNGKQKPYVFHLQNMEKSLFNKNIQFSSSFDRHWFGNDVITNNQFMPKYIEQYIEKLNYNPMNNQYIKKLTSNVTSLQQKWNLKKFSLKNLTTTATTTPSTTASTANNESKAEHDNKTEEENNKYLFDVSKSFSMIFRCGGVYAFNKQRCSECDLTIFNHLHGNNIINAYTLNLPQLPKKISLAASKYNQYNGILYCIGGDTDKQEVISDIYQLNLNNNNNNNITPKWEKNKISLYSARKCVDLCLIDQHNLMIMGGKSKSGEKLTTVELFVDSRKNIDIELNKYRTTKLLSPLCLPRSSSGCLLFNQNDKRVIIGGGFGGFNENTKQTIEFYDCIKNKWYLYPYKTNYEHQFSPILWNNKFENENIIYIGGDCLGIDSVSMLGTIEWIDIRQNKNDKKWNVFKNEKALLQMFHLQNVDEKMWRSRSLLIS